MTSFNWKVSSLSFALTTLVLGCSRSSNNQAITFAGDAGASAGSTRPVRSASARAARVAAATNTKEMLSGLAEDCLPCAENSGCLDSSQQSGLCETVPGKKNGGKLTESAMCLETLRCVFTSKCANPGHQNECICGQTDVVDCMSGKSPPTGTCVAIYKQDFGDDGKFIYQEFVNQTYGAGRANAIAQCVTQMCPTCRIP